MHKKRINIKQLVGTPFLLSEEQSIGVGSFGTVCKVYNKEDPSKELVAKILSLGDGIDQSIESQIKFIREIPYHPNLVNCLKLHISTEHNVYIIMQYCNGGSLESFINKNQNIEEPTIWNILSDICKGYRILYDIHLIHRDLKPQNILIHNGVFKIADFGLSKKVNHHNITQNISTKGTPLYMAPEIMFQETGNSKIDVFSLGIILYRLSFYGQYPFYRRDQNFANVEKYFQHLNKTQVYFPKYPKRSQKLKNLIGCMLKKKHEERIEWKDIFKMEQIKLQEVEENEKKMSDIMVDLERSMVIINKSSARLQIINEPFNFRQSIESETKNLIQFTQFASSFELHQLKHFIFKAKIIISIIKHLNKKIEGIYNTQKFHKHINKHFQKVINLGILYSLDIIDIVISKTKHSVPEQIVGQLQIIQKLKQQKQQFELQKAKHKIGFTYNRLSYENQLYDLLTQFTEYPSDIKETIKIPISFMIDLYDACLKLETIKDQAIQIQLEDTQLDKIQMNCPQKYASYLESKHQITLKQIQGGLQVLGLLFI